jgi:hypothetical protein
MPAIHQISLGLVVVTFSSPEQNHTAKLLGTQTRAFWRYNYSWIPNQRILRCLTKYTARQLEGGRVAERASMARQRGLSQVVISKLSRTNTTKPTCSNSNNKHVMSEPAGQLKQELLAGQTSSRASSTSCISNSRHSTACLTLKAACWATPASTQ